MKSFAFASVRLTAVHLFLVLFALISLSSAQKSSTPPPATNYNFQTLAALAVAMPPALTATERRS
jgi:hypothetical protein